MGLKVTQDWWNRLSDVMTYGFDFCAKIVDDVLAWSDTVDELKERMRSILQRCRERGITVSKRKMQIGQKVEFAGYIVSSEVIFPDPKKTDCLRKYIFPTTF